MQPDRNGYLRSLTNELVSQAKRVRDLIGSKHWYLDGHHKEFLLIELLRRHVPYGFLVSKGFVVNNLSETDCSKEQDVLIVDTLAERPIFNQGDVVICLAHTVRAAISVKTKMSKQTVIDSIESLASVRVVAKNEQDLSAIWNGAFFMEADETVSKTPIRMVDYLCEGLDRHPFPTGFGQQAAPGPDLFAESTDLFCRVSNGKEAIETEAMVHCYRCEGLATAVFLSAILDHLAQSRGENRNSFGEFTQSISATHLTSATVSQAKKNLGG